MEITFKTINELQTLVISAITSHEKVLLNEFMQQEIPGYNHSLQFEFINDSRVDMAFHPTMTSLNLHKDLLNTGNDDPYNIERGNVFFEMHDRSHSYEICYKEDNDNVVIEKGVIRNIYQYRNLLVRLNGYAGKYQ